MSDQGTVKEALREMAHLQREQDRRRDQRVVEAYLEGVEMWALAERFGMASNGIEAVLRRMGVRANALRFSLRMDTGPKPTACMICRQPVRPNCLTCGNKRCIREAKINPPRPYAAYDAARAAEHRAVAHRRTAAYRLRETWVGRA